MPSASAVVFTAVPDRYVKQLLAHLGRKPTIELRAGTLFFGYGTATPDELRAVSQIKYA